MERCGLFQRVGLCGEEFEMTQDNPTPFKERFSEYGTSIFQDPFSDLTHDRQNNLLLASFVTLILSSSLISVTGLSAGAINFTVNSPEVMQQAAGYASIYFLLAYILCVVQDLYAYKYKTLPVLEGTTDMLAKEATDNEAKAKENSRKLNSEIIPKINLLQAEIEAIDEKFPGDSNMRTRYEARKPIYAQLDEQAKLVNELRLTAIDPLYKTMDETSEKKFREKKLLNVSQFLGFIRICIEILFPVAAASFAIWFSLIKN